MNILLYKILFLVLISTQFAHVWAGTIIGDDNRQDLYEIKDPKIIKLAQSTVALIKKHHLLKLPNGNYQLSGEPLRQHYNLCEDEKFSHESLIANCSGALVKKDVILTAAHCVDITPNSVHQMSMNDYYVVFNYHSQMRGQTSFIVQRDDVYEIKAQLHHDFSMKTMIDLALFQLDRPAKASPLAFNKNTHYQVDTPIFMLGHPMGISLKLSDQGRMTKISPRLHTFDHNLDAFSVNSGSPIFHAESHEIIGVMVRGTGMNFSHFGRSCKEWDKGEEPNDWMQGNFLWSLPRI